MEAGGALVLVPATAHNRLLQPYLYRFLLKGQCFISIVNSALVSHSMVSS